jgi:hypothetical protein
MAEQETPKSVNDAAAASAAAERDAKPLGLNKRKRERVPAFPIDPETKLPYGVTRGNGDGGQA